MSAISSDTLLSTLNWRYATKVFDSNKKIPPTEWAALEETLRLSPSSFGLQPWRFYVVEDQNVRAQLKAASWNQSQIVDASHLVVLATRNTIDKDYIVSAIKDIANTRGISAESLAGYQQMMEGSLLTRSTEELKNWATKQVYIALGGFMTASALLGIDACPMEGFDPSAYDQQLKLHEDGYSSAVVVTAGYRSTEDKYASLAKVRLSKQQVIHRR
jgi:nitroreductase